MGVCTGRMQWAYAVGVCIEKPIKECSTRGVWGVSPQGVAGAVPPRSEKKIEILLVKKKKTTTPDKRIKK